MPSGIGHQEFCLTGFFDSATIVMGTPLLRSLIVRIPIIQDQKLPDDFTAGSRACQ